MSLAVQPYVACPGKRLSGVLNTNGESNLIPVERSRKIIGMLAIDEAIIFFARAAAGMLINSE